MPVMFVGVAVLSVDFPTGKSVMGANSCECPVRRTDPGGKGALPTGSLPPSIDYLLSSLTDASCRHALKESSGIESPQLSPATTPFSPSSDSGRSSATILSQLAPSSLINTVLDNWFTHIHPLAPVLHQGHFFRRLADSSSNDPVFIGLVISILAATAATLRRKSFTEYRPITPDRCIQLIQHHGLLPADRPYSLDWCIAKYNLATASMAQRGLSDPLVYRMIGESVTGTSYLLSNELEEMGLLHQELLKRLWCLLEITLMFVSPSVYKFRAQADINSLDPLIETPTCSVNPSLDVSCY